jgi:hypothetical protein
MAEARPNLFRGLTPRYPLVRTSLMMVVVVTFGEPASRRREMRSATTYNRPIGEERYGTS